MPVAATKQVQSDGASVYSFNRARLLRSSKKNSTLQATTSPLPANAPFPSGVYTHDSSDEELLRPKFETKLEEEADFVARNVIKEVEGMFRKMSKHRDK